MSRRVLVLTHNYPRFPQDPAGAFVARLARGVAAAGWRVRVLAPHSPGADETEIDREVDVTRFRYAADHRERVAFVGDARTEALMRPGRLVMLPRFIRKFREAAGELIAGFDPDIVHAHWWIPGGWVAAGSGRPFAVTCHGSDVRMIERAFPLRMLARRVLSRAAAVTAVSQFLADDLERLLDPADIAVRVTRMPIDVESYLSVGQGSQRVDPPRVLYAGNLVASKGLDILLQALAILKCREVRCRLKILGEGPEHSALRLLAGRLEVSELVDWSAFVDQGRMPSEYGASTITVLPSRGKAEGLGLTLVEALLAGSAVVGTRVGGIPEVIEHEVTGLLAAPEDPDDLADQLQRLLDDCDLRGRLVERGRERMRDLHSPAAATAQWLALYNVLAATD